MADESQLLSGVQTRGSRVRTLIAQRQSEEAVRVALEDPPTLSKIDQTKDLNAQNVLATLKACNKGEMQRVVDTLSPEMEDTLMKYLCRFLSIASESSMVLDWHTKLVSKAGAGCIMRAFTDRKTV